MRAGRRDGEVTGDGEGGGGHEVAVPDAVAHGEVAEGGGEEPGGEGVAGADGCDDVHAQGGDGGDVTGAREDRRALRAPLHDQDGRLRQRRPDRLRARHSPCLLRLVLADEDQVAAAGRFEEHLGGRAGVAPQAGPVVDVEGDQRAAGPGRGQVVEQVQAVGGERRGDAGQVQDPGRGQRLVRDVPRRHRGGGGAGPVVGDLVHIGGPVGGSAEVDPGGPRGVAPHSGGVDPVSGDRLDEVVAEAIGADPADPGRPVSGGGQRAGDIGLGPADATAEGGYVGEASGLRRQERHHGLAEANDFGGRGGVGGPGRGSGHSGLLAGSVMRFGARRGCTPLTRRRLGC